jgi:hypothetical protein
MLARRLFFTSPEPEYLELKRITIVDFRIGCEQGAVSSAGARHSCELFGLSLNQDMTHVTMNGIDPFRMQALWSERGSRGVATCTNHSEGSHGRANRKVAGVRSLIRRMTIVIDMLHKKAQHFCADRVNRSPKAVITKLTQSAKKQEGVKTSLIPNECPERCGWGTISANRFMIPNFPCQHTALHREQEIDWARNGMTFGLGDLEPQHDIVARAYAGREWPLAMPRSPKGWVTIQEPEEGFPALGTAEMFIDRLRMELRIAFPRVQLMSKWDLCMEFGRFVQSNSTEDRELQSRFQLDMFRRCSQSR